MKKIFTLALVAVAALFATTAKADIIADSDNKVYFLVENSDDLTKIPVTMYLENPTTLITAAEGYIKLPESLVNEKNDNWVHTGTGNKIKVTGDMGERATEHNAKLSLKTAKVPGYLFVSVTHSESWEFDGTSGAIITVYFDGSSLAEGEYELEVVNAIAVDTESPCNTYTTPDTTPGNGVKFTIANGKATAVESATVEEIAAAKAIYTIGGQKVAAPVKGQIYVIDGKVVKY